MPGVLTLISGVVFLLVLVLVGWRLRRREPPPGEIEEEESP